jgi:hypothetical protein
MKFSAPYLTSTNHVSPGAKQIVVFITSDDLVTFRESGAHGGLTARLLNGRQLGMLFTSAMPGELADPFAKFYTTYNRTRLQEKVRDLITACDRLKSIGKNSSVVLGGSGRAGLCALLAAPAADAVVADCDQVDVSSDEALLAPDLLCPGIRNIGTFEGAAMLAAPHPLLLHNTGDKFPTTAIRSAYQALGATKKLRIESRRLSDDEVAEWIAKLE